MVKINETLDILGGNARGMRSKLLALRSYISNEFQSAKRLQIKVSVDIFDEIYSKTVHAQ